MPKNIPSFHLDWSTPVGKIADLLADTPEKQECKITLWRTYDYGDLAGKAVPVTVVFTKGQLVPESFAYSELGRIKSEKNSRNEII
jgi:hypothetical protein